MNKEQEKEECKQCNGTGSYMYDENHGKFCEECCKHNQGFWELKEYYGNDNGKMCCMAGCGFTKEKDVLPPEAPIPNGYKLEVVLKGKKK